MKKKLKRQGRFIWDEEKEEILINGRGISFSHIVNLINEGKLLAILDNPSKNHKFQMVLVVDVDGYTYAVPFEKLENGDYFLRTIFPDRKYKKLLKKGDEK